MDQANTVQNESQVNFQTKNDTPHRPSFFQKKTNIIGILALLVIAAAIPLTVQLSQQRQSITQQAAEDLACTRNKWNGIPDWLGGSNALGNGYYCGPENPENIQRCGGSLQVGKWVAGPPIPPGGELGHGGNYPNWGAPYGGRTPVTYDSAKDIYRNDFSSHTNAESSWARVLRWSDDVLGGNPDLSPEIVIKHMLARYKRDHIVNNRWNGQEDRYGWDLRAIDHTIYVDGQAGITKMRQETQSCTGTVQPTSTVPINCNVKLQVPPVGHTVPFPPYTSNQCNTGSTELQSCGDYWVSGWCNNAGDATSQTNAVYACRGWSQQGTGAIDNKTRFMLYFSGRLRTMTDDEITASTTYEQRKVIWNNFMDELRNGSIAYPWEFSNASKTAEEVRDNAMNAVANAVFGKSWGVIREQERLNNCPTTWGGTLPAPTNPTAPSTPTNTVAPTATVNPNGTNLQVSVLLHGIGAAGDSDNPDPKDSTKDPKVIARPATLIVSDATDSDQSRREKQFILNYTKATGKYTATVDISNLNLATGNYVIKVKTYSFLTKRFGGGATAITAGQTKTLPEIQLIAADTNNDNELRVDDYNTIRDCVAVVAPAIACDATKKKAADVNDDDVVDQTDYTLFIRELAHRFGD